MWTVRVGEVSHDLSARVLVVGRLGPGGSLEQASRLVAEGADLVEVDRGDLVAGLAPLDIVVSVATDRSEAVEEACGAGAVMVHTRGESEVLAAAASSSATVVLGVDGRGTVDDVRMSFDGLARRAGEAGIPQDRIVLGVRLDGSEASLDLVRHLDGLGRPVLLDAGPLSSPAVHALAIARGCRILRTHDVKAAARVAAVMTGILGAGEAKHG